MSNTKICRCSRGRDSTEIKKLVGPGDWDDTCWQGEAAMNSVEYGRKGPEDSTRVFNLFVWSGR